MEIKELFKSGKKRHKLEIKRKIVECISNVISVAFPLFLFVILVAMWRFEIAELLVMKYLIVNFIMFFIYVIGSTSFFNSYKTAIENEVYVLENIAYTVSVVSSIMWGILTVLFTIYYISLIILT